MTKEMEDQRMAVATKSDAVAGEAEPNPAAIVADSEAQLAELRKRQQQLALDSLGDDSKLAELAEVENSIYGLERKIQLAHLAEAERQRREVQAERDAEAKARSDAQRRAAAIRKRLDAVAERADEAAAAFAEAVTLHQQLTAEHRTEREVAGMAPGLGGTGWASSPYEAALRFALNADCAHLFKWENPSCEAEPLARKETDA